MDLLKEQIIVNRAAYEKITYGTMTDSLEDAYNKFLSKFVARKKDENYGDNAHQYLTTEDGKLYYFDSFKYIYPADNSEDVMQVLNSNVGRNKLCIVEYTGTAVIIQDWDFDSESVKFTSGFITDETRKYINEAYGQKISMGYFLLQLSGNNYGACKSLEIGSTVTVKAQESKLVVYDSEGNVVDTNISLPSQSFYNQVAGAIDYYNLLDKNYSEGRRRNNA